MVADIYSPQARSALMSRVRGTGNASTELKLIAIFREQGITGWRRNAKVFGRPDFVFPKRRVAVFVDGCFWHGCPTHGTLPATRPEFWETKIDRNRARDREVNRTLRLAGWRVLRLWEHELRFGHRPVLLKKLRRVLSS